MILETVAGLAAAPAPPLPTEGPRISALFLLIPAALLVVVGVWGWRNAASLADTMPLDERSRDKRARTYRRGSAFCVAVAVAFVVFVILSFLTVGGPR